MASQREGLAQHRDGIAKHSGGKARHSKAQHSGGFARKSGPTRGLSKAGRGKAPQWQSEPKYAKRGQSQARNATLRRFLFPYGHWLGSGDENAYSAS